MLIETKISENLNSNQVIIPKETQLLFEMLTKKVTSKNLTNSINTIGTIKNYPQNVVEIKTPFSGKVFFSNLEIGNKVTKNQDLGYIEQAFNAQEKLAFKTNELDLKLKILELETKIKNSNDKITNSKKEYENSKLSNQSKNIQLDKQIEQAKLNFELIKKEYNRTKELLNTGSASIKKLQEVENNFNLAKTEIEVLQKQKIYIINSESLKKVQDSDLQLKIDRQDLNLAKKQLSEIENIINNDQKQIEITSPINGIISKINSTNSNQEEANKVLVTIINSDKIILEAEVFEKDIPAITKSKTGEFTLSSYPNEIFKIDGKENKFISINNSLDVDKRTLAVIFELDNKNNKFKDGMFANISLSLSNSEKKLVIEKNSILEDLGKKFVFVYKNPEIFEKKEIITGKENQQYIEVIQGLSEGEKIATQSIYQLNSALIGKK